MTLAELAEEIKVTPEELFEYFEKTQKTIPRVLEFDLSEELVSEIMEMALKKLIARQSEDLIKEIRKLNNLEHLVLSGKFKKRNETNNFGYFQDVHDTHGNVIYYPNYHKTQGKLRIREIYIFNPIDLYDGERYHFKCELANNKERLKQKNPYLLQTTINKVKNVSRLNDIAIAIKEKETDLEELEGKIEFVKSQMEEKEKSANETIEEYNNN